MSLPFWIQLTLRFRVFDDGIGFRYEYTVPTVDSLLITDELTTFRFHRDGTSWSIPASAETYELLYQQQPISEVETANTPFTFKTADGVYGSIHEAALYDFPEMTLKQIGHYTLKAELAPWPDGIKARKGNHFTTSWRTVHAEGRKSRITGKIMRKGRIKGFVGVKQEKE